MSDKMDGISLIREAIKKASDLLAPPGKKLYSEDVALTKVKVTELVSRTLEDDADDTTMDNVWSNDDNFVIPSVIYGVTGLTEAGGSFQKDRPLHFQIQTRGADYEQSDKIDDAIWQYLKSSRRKAILIDYSDDYDVETGVYVSKRTIAFLG